MYHGGKAPQVRDAAHARLMEMADSALFALAQIVESSDSDQTKLQAAKDILDRVGLGAIHKSEATVVSMSREEIERKLKELRNDELAQRRERKSA